MIAHLQLLAVQIDGLPIETEAEIIALLAEPGLHMAANAFVITDDDDELNTWSQAGTLDGIIGETVGYTLLRVMQDEQGYHLRCQGTVHPQYRHQHAGRALLRAALNRAHVLSEEFEGEAKQRGLPIYFEVLLPIHDAASARLASKFGMLPTDEAVQQGLCLYRYEL
jgi:GNAT superfamily N-acetyltransferase